MNDIKNATIDIPKFSLKNDVYIAKCVKCYDADSIHVVIFFHDKLQRFVCRLAEIDAFEISSKNLLEKEHATKARDFLSELILNKLILIKCDDFDKYGRLLVYVYSYNPCQEKLDDFIFENSINNILVDKKLAYKYDGGTKKDFTTWSDQ